MDELDSRWNKSAVPSEGREHLLRRENPSSKYRKPRLASTYDNIMESEILLGQGQKPDDLVKREPVPAKRKLMKNTRNQDQRYTPLKQGIPRIMVHDLNGGSSVYNSASPSHDSVKRTRTEYQGIMNTDLEDRSPIYKPLNSAAIVKIKNRQKKEEPGPCYNWYIYLIAFCVLMLFIFGILFGYFIRHNTSIEEGVQAECCKEKMRGLFDPGKLVSLHENMMFGIKGDGIIQKWIREYSEKQLLVGSQLDTELIKLIQEHFHLYGIRNELTGSKFNEEFLAYMSLPDETKANYVQILDSNGQVLLEERAGGPLRRGQSSRRGRAYTKSVPPFVAYSASGIVQGNLVYMNYGCPNDLDLLSSSSRKQLFHPTQAKIALIRDGGCPLLTKLKLLEKINISGALLYQDPADAKYMSDASCTSDSSAIYSSLLDSSDEILEPGEELPNIPVQTINCGFAKQLLRNMTGERAPDSWQGDLTEIYKLGFISAGQGNWSVKLSVHITKKKQLVQNVVGTFISPDAPDQYVILGASRNSYQLGVESSAIGSASLLEIGRNLGYLARREGWRPKHSIMLVSWGGTEYSNAGMEEFLQKYAEYLSGRVLAYIDLDKPVRGNYKLDVTSSEVLQEIIYITSQRVPSPNEKQNMIYDTWRSQSMILDDEKEPPIQSIESNEKTSSFHQLLGAPVARMQFTAESFQDGKQTKFQMPVESLRTLEHESQHHYQHIRATTRLAGLLAISLADSDILQYDLKKPASVLQMKANDLLLNNLSFDNETLDEVFHELNRLRQATDQFYAEVKPHIDPSETCLLHIITQHLIYCQQFISRAITHLHYIGITLQNDDYPPEHAHGNISKFLTTLKMASFSLHIDII